MIDLPHLAKLEEGHCAATLREVGRESIVVAGGVACRDAPGTWVNRAEGIGLSGPVADEEVRRLVAWYDEANLDAQVKICPFVHESLLAALGAAGFVVRRFEQLLYRRIARDERVVAPRSLPGEIEICRVDPADDAACRELAEVINRGFAPPGVPPLEANIQLSIKCVRRERADTFAAYHDGVCIGGGGVEAFEEIGCLYGAVVDEKFRRRGVQQALLAARLNAAAARGLRFATIGSAPGHDTERNAQRFGFAVAYFKAVLVRPRSG